jgi:hypothetical protein
MAAAPFSLDDVRIGLADCRARQLDPDGYDRRRRWAESGMDPQWSAALGTSAGSIERISGAFEEAIAVLLYQFSVPQLGWYLKALRSSDTPWTPQLEAPPTTMVVSKLTGRLIREPILITDAGPIAQSEGTIGRSLWVATHVKAYLDFCLSRRMSALETHRRILGHLANVTGTIGTLPSKHRS